MSDDDGLGGPAGARFGAALAAAAERGLAVGGYPRAWAPWVDQAWHGRRLTIGVSSYGARGVTTGYRWVAVHLRTARRLGPWADVSWPGRRPDEGMPVPPEVWAEDPALGRAVGDLAARLGDDAVALQVRPTGVMWQLRASRVDGPTLGAALDLLAAVAAHAEAHDATHSARLGRPAAVRRGRRTELVAALVVLGLTGLVVAVVAALALS